jgi:uncharacterized protein YbaR (Trm112 family)
MIKFKACPKCRGDLFLQSDHYGKYLQCFQCARIFDLEALPKVHRQQEAA